MSDPPHNQGLSDDAPIVRPDQDLFGLDPFAKATAKTIRAWRAPEGAVVAFNGSWGSGKSSAVNLAKHYLADAISADELVIVDFNPWWFAGPDALTLAFFKRLSSALEPTVSGRARDALAYVGQQLSTMGPIAGSIANLKAPGIGSIISGLFGFAGKKLEKDKTVEKSMSLVRASLLSQKRQYIVVIDDIDRLSPEDALTMFRLVKSVGRLPNLIYLLAFDRELAERIVSERFPSEGASYLQKIVQASYDVPLPRSDVLRGRFLAAATAPVGQPENTQAVRFMNIFYDVIAPLLITPRDAVRLTNEIFATWNGVEGEVDKADFLALAAIRTFAPSIYKGIRDHPEDLCDEAERGAPNRPQKEAYYDALLNIAPLPDMDRERWRRALRRIFPRLDAVWSNTYHSSRLEYRRDRRLCSAEHFRTYFSMSISPEIISASEMRALMEKIDSPDDVRTVLLNNLKLTTPVGRTRSSLFLDELTVYASVINKSHALNLVTLIFSIADELDSPADEPRAFEMVDNRIRIFWLLNLLVNDRFSIDERDKLYLQACQTASLGWICYFAESCRERFEVREGRRSDPIISEDEASKLVQLALDRIRNAARNSTILSQRRLVGLLFEWKRFSPDGFDEVRAWTDQALSDDRFVIAMAEQIPSRSWSQGMGFDGMGDRVAQANYLVDLDTFRELIDVNVFEQRVEQLLRSADVSPSTQAVLERFQTLPRGSHGGRRPLSEDTEG